MSALRSSTLRKVTAFSNAETLRSATVYRDVEWDEYLVAFSDNGKPLSPAADYHSDDLGDATDTARHWIGGGV